MVWLQQHISMSYQKKYYQKCYKWNDIMNRSKCRFEYDWHWPTLSHYDLINSFDLSMTYRVCLLYFNTCVPTGWSCVIVPKGWASWLVARLVTWWCSPKGTLFISSWWNRPSFISPTARTGLLGYSRIARRDSSPGNRPISTSRCWVEYRCDMELEDFCVRRYTILYA